jgi:hypothetical protein
MPWETVRRGTPNTSGSSASFVTLRRSAVAFSAHFIRSNNLLKMTRVTIKTDRESRRLGFVFHIEADDPESLALTQDGGQKSSGSDAGRAVQTAALMRQPWMKALLANRMTRRFVPYKEFDLWVIDLGPGFEVEVTDPLEVPSEVTGVYRYLDGDEVTYIGRGRIRQRVQESHRDHWAFDRVQFSPLNDTAAEQHWEQVLLEEYEAANGRLPRENRVRGFKSAPQES